MSTTAVIQARMSSSRLPGKVLLPLGGSTILGWVVSAAARAKTVDQVVVATSAEDSDDRVVAEARRLDVPVVRGPLTDVLDRYLVALKAHPSEIVVRLTADCPFLDPRVIDLCVETLASDSQLSLVTNVLVRTHPRGLDVEAVRSTALQKAAREAVGHHRAHVTSWLMTHPADYTIAGVSSSLDAGDLRVTVDTTADLEVVTAVVSALGRDAQDADVLVPWLRAHPEIIALNAHVEQKREDQG
ncbi:MAG TPA: spore coat protein [Actinobacteria bacterium]|nr:spore coat protein [Actinomycetota bacterium]